jgi:hypothetical protein
MTATSRAWQRIRQDKVPAKPVDGIWTPILDYVTGPVILRITANGEWRPAADLKSCSADGFRHWAFGRDALLAKKAPPGALIGKWGGSNIATDDGEIFLVGTYAVVTVEKPMGPLYLTINDAAEFFDDNSGELEVSVEQAD